MNKSVLISIRPKWCELIADGKKTVEVRKTRPKLETPFKCYIYCTKADPSDAGDDFYIYDMENYRTIRGDGKVIGEFWCDYIRYANAFDFVVKEDGEKTLEGSCIDRADLFKYLGWKTGMSKSECTPFYKWHISELIIYDKPRKIVEFRRICRNNLYCESCAMYSTRNGICGNVSLKVRRPPQSWCYVEDLGGDDEDG